MGSILLAGLRDQNLGENGVRDQNNGKKIGINGSRIYHVTTLQVCTRACIPTGKLYMHMKKAL